MPDDFDEEHELMMVGGVGSVTTISETPKKQKKKVWKRPIGFITDLDRLEEADE